MTSRLPVRGAKGFTLIEILVVIGIIAILAAIVIIAVNPSRQFAQASNAQRESDVNAIINAIGQNLADNKGVLNSSCPSITASSTISNTTGSGLVNLSCLVPTYLAALPFDPSKTSAADTGYFVNVIGGRYIVCAPGHADPNVPGSTAFCIVR